MISRREQVSTHRRKPRSKPESKPRTSEGNKKIKEKFFILVISIPLTILKTMNVRLKCQFRKKWTLNRTISRKRKL
uniref:Ubiquitin specific peptidase 16 n=1 Tax=Molossus molossus TaxID=27622 RepID=A0A7J8I3B9_MOLMO|nr:ubiquitin specific peptidase 16 [Molossus molossus]